MSGRDWRREVAVAKTKTIEFRNKARIIPCDEFGVCKTKTIAVVKTPTKAKIRKKRRSSMECFLEAENELLELTLSRAYRNIRRLVQSLVQKMPTSVCEHTRRRLNGELSKHEEMLHGIGNYHCDCCRD